MADLSGQPGHLQFTVTITRKATGAVETYDMVGYVAPEPLEATEPTVAPISKPQKE